MKRSKQNIKHIAQRALELEYGFAPTLSAITVHKSSPDGTHILFEVNGKKYRFDSYKMNVGGFDSVYIATGQSAGAGHYKGGINHETV